MQAAAIAGRGAEKRQHDGEQQGERLGPGCGLIDHVTRIDCPGDDGGDQHQSAAAEPNAEPIERVHGAAKRAPRAGARLSDRRAHSTAWTRLIMSAKRGPYLSQTGLTAAWNGCLSMVSVT